MIRNEWFADLLEVLQHFYDTAESDDEIIVMNLLDKTLHDNLKLEFGGKDEKIKTD